MKKYLSSIILLCIVILWTGLASHNVVVVEERRVIVIDWNTKEPISTPCHYDVNWDFKRVGDIEYISPTPTITPTPTPTITPIPTPTPILVETIEEEWIPYLATSYNVDENSHGNKGAELYGKNVVAMWQSDTDYTKYKSMTEPFKSFICNKDLAIKYGALPYGTKIEIRIWNNVEKCYNYLGEYEALDDSPTTIYNLSEVATKLYSDKSTFHFDYEWTSIDYKGNPIKRTSYVGYIPNWKIEYNNKVKGWLDIANSYIGMAIVEIRVTAIPPALDNG